MRLSMGRCALALAIGFGMAVGMGPGIAAAQSSRGVDADGNPRPPRAPSRITVTPNRQLVRECNAWYALEHRVAGDVMTPQMQCRWVYR